MKNFQKKVFQRNIKSQEVDNEFTISKDIPQPIRNINQKVLMKIIKVLRELTVGSSFPIRNELDYAVRKLAKIYVPEYKIVIRSLGDSKRVYRKA